MLLRMCCKILGRHANNEQYIVTISKSKCTGHLREEKKNKRTQKMNKQENKNNHAGEKKKA